MNKIDIFFDGACHNIKGNNNPMGLGIAVFINDEYREELSRAILYKSYKELGTSVVAEWLALVNALKIAKELKKDFEGRLNIYGDSQLVVNQFNLLYRINKEKLKIFFNKSKSIANEIGISEIIWIKREFNKKADELSKEGLKLYKEKK